MIKVPHHLPCFGRAADLDRLAARITTRGVTFVMAPPRMGKTWLVRNLAFERAQHDDWTIGYAESSSGKNDLLREVVNDLYKRWLLTSNMIAQARSLWDRHHAGLVGKVGCAIGQLLSDIAGLASPELSTAQKLIDETFSLLTRAEQDLRTGGLTLEPITYENARDLVRTVATVTDHRPILLVMDAWERGQTLAGDRGSIEKLLDNDHDWPEHFHLIVVIRDLPDHLEEVRFANLCCETHPTADRYHVSQLNLSNLEEQDRLLTYLTAKLPAVTQVKRNWVIEQCTNPAVIEWWLRRQPKDEATLHSEAANAHNQQYLGLFTLIQDLPTHEALFKTTVRLALLPELTSAAMWQPYRTLFDPATIDATVADLQSRRILDPDRPEFPSFGHTTAYDAVRTFLLRTPTGPHTPDLRPHVRILLRKLIAHLTRRVRTVTEADKPFGLALVNLKGVAVTVALSEPWCWPARLAAGLFPRRSTAVERGQLLGAREACKGELPRARALLSVALFNGLIAAQAERDFACRDALLKELGNLLRDYPRDVCVRERYAKGLCNAIHYASGEHNLRRRGELLDRLRGLSHEYLADDVVRHNLAVALFNTLNDVQDEGDIQAREALLDELRRLSKAFPRNGAVRAKFAQALSNLLYFAKPAGHLENCDDLLRELSTLSNEHPADTAVRKELARALLLLLDPIRENSLQRCLVHLDNLRALSRAYPEDAAVREQLAKGLFNTLIDAKAESDFPRRDALLDELRALSRAHPEDAAVRERLAKGLYNTLIDAKDENDLSRRDALLDELRALSQAYPEDAAVREQLAKGLFNTRNDAQAENDLPRRDALLDELRELFQAHPEDAAVRKQFAKGLFNTLFAAKAENDLSRRDTLLVELRSLSRTHPEDAVVRERLAKALFNTLVDAKAENDLSRRDALLAELRALLNAHPDDGRLDIVRDALAHLNDAD